MHNSTKHNKKHKRWRSKREVTFELLIQEKILAGILLSVVILHSTIYYLELVFLLCHSIVVLLSVIHIVRKLKLIYMVGEEREFQWFM